MANPLPKLPPQPNPLHVAIVDPATGIMNAQWQTYFAALDKLLRALSAKAS